MKTFLFYFAVTGWTISIIVHSLALTGIDATSKIPFVWLLHVGIFVVWLPAVLKLRKNPDLAALQQSGIAGQMNPFAFFQAIFKYTPTWISAVAIMGFFYAVINLTLFMASQQGSPDIGTDNTSCAITAR